MRTTGRSVWTGTSWIIAGGMAIGWLAGCGSSVSAPHPSPIQSVSELRDPAPRPGEPAALSRDAVSNLVGAIAAREYWASERGGALQAPNRSQNLRTLFEPSGVRIHDRTAEGSPKLVDLTLSGLGRGESLSVVLPGEVSHAEARVEIAREALGLVEWFENTDEGLEQGLTLNERPTSADVGPTQAPLVVELSVKGATATRSGDSVVLATQAGRSLEYGHLAVVDVRGVALASHFEVPSADRIRLVVDDAAATYPIVIDPLLTRLFDTRLESNQIDGHLGQSVASAGDVNGDGYEDMISAKGNGFGPPVVYIHHGGPNGIAKLQQSSGLAARRLSRPSR